MHLTSGPVPSTHSADTDDSERVTETRRKLKRFNYIVAYDELLCKCVREHDAHKAGHGKKIEAFEAVRCSFINNISPRVFLSHEKPSAKSVRDRYIRLEERRRDEVRENAAMSGNLETTTDLDLLLDDLILEKDECEESRRAERDEQNAREQQLNAAGATIRQLAVARKRRISDTDDVTESETPKKQTRGTSNSALEDVSACMVESVERQQEHDGKKIELDEKRFRFEVQRAEKDEERFNRTQTITERKLDLEERRFEFERKDREERMKLEREEREGAREERRAMIDLMRSLVKSSR